MVWYYNLLESARYNIHQELYFILQSICYNRLIDTWPILDELAVNGAVFVYSASSTSFLLLSLATVDCEIFPLVQQRTIDDLFVCRRNGTGTARLSDDFQFCYFLPFFRPLSNSPRSRFVRSRRPRVRAANFAIKQSDARTISIMTVEKARGGRRRIEPVRG